MLPPPSSTIRRSSCGTPRCCRHWLLSMCTPTTNSPSPITTSVIHHCMLPPPELNHPPLQLWDPQVLPPLATQHVYPTQHAHVVHFHPDLIHTQPEDGLHRCWMPVPIEVPAILFARSIATMSKSVSSLTLKSRSCIWFFGSPLLQYVPSGSAIVYNTQTFHEAETDSEPEDDLLATSRILEPHLNSESKSIE
jgi:hypothetical protein